LKIQKGGKRIPRRKKEKPKQQQKKGESAKLEKKLKALDRKNEEEEK